MAKRFKVSVAKLDANDPRITIAMAAGALRANQVWNEDGWRKVPAQCPIACELIKGEPAGVIIAILDAWNAAYRAQCRSYEDAALAWVV